MQSVMMVRALFEVNDNYDQAEHRLSQEVAKLKEALQVQTEKLDETNRQLTKLSKDKKSFKVSLSNLSQEVKKLKGSTEEVKVLKNGNEELKVLLKEAQLEILYVGKESFDRVKA